MTSNSEIIKDIVLEKWSHPFILETNSLNSICANNENINDVVVDKQMSTKIFDDSKLNSEKIKQKKYEIDVLKQWSFKEDIDARDITLIADNMDILKDKIGLGWNKKTNERLDWNGTKTVIENYKKQIIKGEYTIYQPCKKSKKGRHFSKTTSLQGISRSVRHTLCKGKYLDIDMKKCHIFEFIAICKTYNFNCDKIEYYVDNGDDCLERLMWWTTWDKDRCKQSVLSLLNGGNIREIFSKSTIETPIHECCEWLRDFRDQVYAIHQNFFDHPAFDDHKQLLIKDKDVGINAFNFRGKLVNKVLCEFENILIQHAIHYCDSFGIEIGANCFDGLLLKICDRLNDDFIKSMENYIVEQVGIPAIFVVKDMDEGFDISGMKTRDEQKTISKELKQIEKTEKKEQKIKEKTDIHSFQEKFSDEYLAKVFINNTVNILYKDVIQNCIYQYNDQTCLYERLESIDHLKNIFTNVLEDYIESVIPENESQSDFKTGRKNDLLSARGQANLLALVKIKIPDSTKTIMENFNRKNLFPFQDKVVDFSLSKDNPDFIRKRTRDDYCTFTTDNVYKSDFDEKWLFNHAKELLMTDNLEYVNCFYTLLAHGLTNDNSIKLITFWLGEGDNGKSAMMNLFKSVMGDFCCPDASKAILEKKGSCLDTEKFILVGKRIATISELKKENKLDTLFVKNVSGDDREHMLRPKADSIQIPVIIDCKFVIPSNEMPHIPEKDGALLKRLVCFNFCNIFARSSDKWKEILSKKDDLFTYLCHLASELTQNKFVFIQCDEMTTFTRTIKNTIDSVGGFMDDWMEMTDDPKDFITARDLHNHYLNYCQQYNREYVLIDPFGKALRKQPYNFNTKERKRPKKIAGKAIDCYFFLKKRLLEGEIVEDDDGRPVM